MGIQIVFATLRSWSRRRKALTDHHANGIREWVAAWETQAGVCFWIQRLSGHNMPTISGLVSDQSIDAAKVFDYKSAKPFSDADEAFAHRTLKVYGVLAFGIKEYCV